jgi:hypothetical protein
MKKILIHGLLFSVLLGTAAAESGQNRWQMGLAFEPFFPQGEFHDVMDRIGWGGSMDLLYRIPDSALHIGAAFDVWVKVSTANAVFSSHALLRLQPQVGPARPYIEGLIGLQHLTTDTRVYDDSDWEYKKIAGTNHIRSTVFSYGLGGGLMLSLYGRAPSAEKGPFAVLLDVGIRYIRGGSAYYMQPGDIELGGGGVTYYVNRSRTDMLMPRVGVAFAF